MNFDKDTKSILIWCTICVIIIFLYGKYRCDNPDYNDILLTKLNIGDLDGWSISHFTFFFILGYLYPQKIKLTVFLGILWEIFEYLYDNYKPTFLDGFGHCVTTDPKKKNVIWWYGKISDIFVNYSGFVIGSYLKTNRLTYV